MRTARWTRSFLLCATTFIATSQTIGCDERQNKSSKAVDLSKSDAGIFKPCAKYSHLQEAYGYCLYKFSGGFRTKEELDMFCPQAGDWEQECRHAWVSGRMQPDSGYKTKDLLEACGGNPDCTFELLDFRPDDDILAQIELCATYVKKHVRDCVGHSMQRWWYSDPDSEEVTRVISVPSPVPDRVAFYVAAAVQCKKKGSCEGETYLQRICEKNVSYFVENPQKCPSESEIPMESKFSPKDLTPKNGMGTYRPPGLRAKENQGVQPAKGHKKRQHKSNRGGRQNQRNGPPKARPQ